MIGGFSKLQIGLMAAALILVVLFLSAPRLPREVEETVSGMTPIDDEVQNAVDLVQNGGQPMQGILKLREILDNDPDNIDAAWHLGLFSIQSGQYENAIKRFGQVVEHDEKGKYKEAHIYLGKTHATLGDTERAKSSFSEYIEAESDTSLTNRVKEMVVELDRKS